MQKCGARINSDRMALEAFGAAASNLVPSASYILATLQAALANGITGDDLVSLTDTLVKTNESFRVQSKHTRLHCAPVGKSKAKAKAKSRP